MGRGRPVAIVLLVWFGSILWSVPEAAGRRIAAPQNIGATPADDAAVLNAALKQYCVTCHN